MLYVIFGAAENVNIVFSVVQWLFKISKIVFKMAGMPLKDTVCELL